jgi:DNA-directed RNA polymerase alpha subunit
VSGTSLRTQSLSDADFKASIRSLGLRTRTSNLLFRNRIRTVGQLVSLTQSDIASLGGSGLGTINDIVTRLASVGLELSGDPNASPAPFQMPRDLSAELIEELNLSPGILNALCRHGIHTVGRLVRMDDIELLSIRGIGGAAFSQIRSALRLAATTGTAGVQPLETQTSTGEATFESMGTDEPQPLISPDKYDFLTRSGIDWNRVSVEVLGLPTRYQRRLATAGATTLGQLFGLDSVQLLDVPHFGPSAFASTVDALNRLYDQVSAGWSPPLLPLPCLSVDVLKLDVRQWSVLASRYGLGVRLTLAEAAARLPGSPTRERARQIESAAIDRIVKRLNELRLPLDRLEVEFDTVPTSADAPPSTSTLREQVNTLLERMGWESISPGEFMRLVVAIRALCAREHAVIESRWPKFSFAVCLLGRPIIGHTRVSSVLEQRALEDRERTREWTYEELAVAVLQEAGKPLHWKEINKRAEAIGRRSNFSLQSLFNMLGAKPETFVRIDQGTYGLAEWGLQEADYYNDIIAFVLKTAGRPLSYWEIERMVNARRSIRSSSLTMLLTMYPRFYQSVDGEYGLRAWLPPRSMQTLRTPRTHVEMDDSLRRLVVASSRGYDVEAIVRRDLIDTDLSPPGDS